MKVDLSKQILGFDGNPLVSKVEGVLCTVVEDGTQVLMNYGVEVKSPNGEIVELIDSRKPRTIGSLLLQLVTTPLDKDSKQTGPDRIRLFDLAQKIHKAMNKSVKEQKIILSAEDVVELKERALILFYDPQIFTGISLAIDPGSRKK